MQLQDQLRAARVSCIVLAQCKQLSFWAVGTLWLWLCPTTVCPSAREPTNAGTRRYLCLTVHAPARRWQDIDAAGAAIP